VLETEGAAALQYGPTEGNQKLRSCLPKGIAKRLQGISKEYFDYYGFTTGY
jgi:hypothetical protein